MDGTAVDLSLSQTQLRQKIEQERPINASGKYDLTQFEV